MDSREASEAIDSGRKYVDLTGQIQIIGDEPVYDGNYSKVYKGMLGGEQVAVKVLKYIPGKSSAAMERKLRREMEICAEHKNAFIADFLGHARGPKLGLLGAIIFPWYENGDSHTYLESRKDTATFWDRIDLFWNVVSGTMFLHQNGIVHGDIKPGNVLISENGDPKICDFGLARLFLDAQSGGLTTTSEFSGTPRYLAVELLTSESTPPTTASDVWALGCLGLEYMFGILPYAHRPNNNRGVIYQDIKSGRLPYERTDKLGLDDAVQEMLHLCWHRDHTRRLRVYDVLFLAMLIQGRRLLRVGMHASTPRMEVYELAHIMRYVHEKRPQGVPLFLRPSATSVVLQPRGVSLRQGWRQCSLFRVDTEATLDGAHWNIYELYSGSRDVLANPEEAQIVTRAGIAREYEAIRRRGESPFPLLPVSEWPLHGKGSIIEPGWL